MKKCLFVLPLLLLCSVGMYGQSIKFTDLVYFTTLNNSGVYNNLRQGSVFKQDYLEEVNGQEMEYFKRIGANPNSERIITGKYTKLDDGAILRTVNYTSTDVQNIINMIGQAKRYGLDLQFRGTDNTNNIYLLSNNFYLVSVYVRRDQTFGLVEVKQKEYLNID